MRRVMALTREVTRPFGEIGFDLPGRAARPPMPWTWRYEKPDGEVVPPPALARPRRRAATVTIYNCRLSPVAITVE
jgi:hypothetical protein